MKKLAISLEVVGFTAFLTDVIIVIIKFLREETLIGIPTTTMQFMSNIAFIVFIIFVICIVTALVLRLIIMKLYSKGMDEVKELLSRFIALGIIGIVFIVAAFYFVYYIIAGESLVTLL